MENAQRVARWLRPMVLPADIIKNPPADRLEARHVNVNDKTAALAEWSLTDLDAVTLSSSCEDIGARLQDDASQLGGMQRYILTAWQGDKCLGRMTVRAKGEEAEDKDDGVLSEPANAKGLVAQTQRHLEAIMKTALIHASGPQIAMNMLVKQNEQMASMLEQSLDAQMEAFKLTQELLNDKTKREIKVAESQAKIESRNNLVKQLAPLASVIVRKFTGATAEGQKSPEIIQLKAFIESLSEEQQTTIVSALTTTQQLALQDLLTTDEAEESGNAPS